MAKPIDLSRAEVHAALADELSLIVRPVRVQPDANIEVPEEGFIGCASDGRVVGRQRYFSDDEEVNVEWVCFPQRASFVPGTTLWGRETWAGHVEYWPDGRTSEIPVYRVDIEQEWLGSYRWRSPITMPRWASRITLTVTGVEVVRLQEVHTGQQIEAGHDDGCGEHVGDQFEAAWATRYGKHYPWGSNPWVWLIGVS